MTTLFETLLLKLATVLELIQQSEVALSPQIKQALVHATNDFKESLKQAKEAANNLPGGELSVGEQDEVIEMLQRLKNNKRQQLAAFSNDVESISAAAGGVNMEIDSTASTPCA
ncbi:hypothetical protein AcW1_000210 [Taiwanofungus camphoratus]|nr:hypothetical protein AcW2_001296 [Antrodia cinnamomea]KAI0935782.1 hypothetical protein AcV5_004107 [Antrodia cinnamomea]KAI0961005.1 hypothetical protein AcV7_000227 [Antrodia cinnamomea]KAI0963001.1 hypothetical protein AcW1_000210 [Antrodia cinnamomea]